MSDLVSCACGHSHDRMLVMQCPHCGNDLWGDAIESSGAGTGSSSHTPTESGGDQDTLIVSVAGRTITVQPGESIAIGRHDDYPLAPIFDAHENISRIHATIRFDGDAVFVTDNDSTNGTFVNGTKIAKDVEYEVLPGHTVRFAADVSTDLTWSPRTRHDGGIDARNGRTRMD